MQALYLALILCAAVVVAYPPAALAIFVLGAIVTGWAAWSKARARRARERRRSNAHGSPTSNDRQAAFGSSERNDARSGDP